MSLPLFSYSFRPFFLAAAGFAIFTLALWLLAFHGYGSELPQVSAWWHAHEMVVGFAGAVIAGFLLTAVATWTGRPPVRGGMLAALVLAWLAGRLAMAFAGSMPDAIVLVDLAFPVLFAVIVSREVIAGRSRRNYGIVVLVWVLAGINGLYHAGQEQTASYLFVHLLALLVVVIGGRVVPAFTGNWLRSRGATSMPVARRSIELTVVPLSAVGGIANSLFPGSALAGVAAIAAGIVNGIRLSGWRGLAAVGDPIVFVLHVAYAWLAVGYLLLGLAALTGPIPASAGLHALTVGGLGGMILAMMTRVALGHTGRPLRAARPTTLAYLLLGLAALLRTASPLSGAMALPFIDLSAASWMLAFGLFLWVYLPVLTLPRPDTPGGRR